MGVSELSGYYRNAELSPVEAVNASFQRIDEFNAKVNAFCFVDYQGALQAARESEDRWKRGEPLSAIDGVPTTIKDVAFVKGWTTSLGSRALNMNAPAEWSSPAVDRLIEAGAVLIGQTATPEIGWKGTTDNTRYGITRNPWNTSTTPGGSSGGAAAAAALGMGCLHLGTDGGGSVRIPAGFTGIVGHKPSFGRIPAYPPSPYTTLAHIGPMARSIEDAAHMLNIMSRPDPRDWYALPYNEVDYTKGLESGVKGIRIAYSPTLGYVTVDPNIAALVKQAVAVFEELGAIVEEVDPAFDCPADMFETLWFAGAAARVKHLSKEQRELLDPGLLEIVKQGEHIAISDYLEVCVARAEFGQNLNQFHQKYDLLMTPTLPIPAFTAGVNSPFKGDNNWWIDWTPFTYPFNLSQQPACSVPCGLTPAGLPAGLQIIGPMHDDIGVLRAARAYEAICPPVFPEKPL